MKLHYFRQVTPDPDDVALAQAIAEGLVPAGCLLGGPLLAQALIRAASPCAGCAGPRARCGGEPPAEPDAYEPNWSEERRLAWLLSLEPPENTPIIDRFVRRPD